MIDQVWRDYWREYIALGLVANMLREAEDDAFLLTQEELVKAEDQLRTDLERDRPELLSLLESRYEEQSKQFHDELWTVLRGYVLLQVKRQITLRSCGSLDPQIKRFVEQFEQQDWVKAERAAGHNERIDRIKRERFGV